MFLRSSLKNWVLFANVIPSLLSIRELRDVNGEVSNGHSNLLHSVKISQSDSVVIEGVEIDCDSEGDSAFVCAGITLTDCLPRIIDLGGDTSTCQ